MSTFSSPLSLEAEQSSTEELIVYEEKNITLKAPEDGKAITIKIEEVEEQVERHEQTVGIKLIVTMFGLCMSVFCVALDNTIISTAIPRITDEFHTLKDVGWYGSGTLSISFLENSTLINLSISSYHMRYAAASH